MPIVCLEGPSAVGKTATASALAAAGACVVPEVNEIFPRPAAEAPDWYLERQVERWTMAARAPALAILDGDPFQPLWYNWSYGFDGRQSLDELAAFYRPRILRGDIGFPNLYVILGAPADALRARKEGDAKRRRHGFDAHLLFIRPQRRYFAAMQSFAPARVRFAGARDVAETVRLVSAAARMAVREERPAELFDHMVEWLRGNDPSALVERGDGIE
ncbi:MAG TPA: hypothetical protein VF584_22755 [Longimicrobium sp.]|jgi:hypothetical protein